MLLQPSSSRQTVSADTDYADSPIGMEQDDMEMDGRPSMQLEGRHSTQTVSPSQIGTALAAHAPVVAPAASSQSTADTADSTAATQASPAAAASSTTEGRNLDALLSELDGEVDSRCQLIVNNTGALADAFRSKFKTQIARLNKKTKTMPLSEFAEAYGVGVPGATAVASSVRYCCAEALGWR